MTEAEAIRLFKALADSSRLQILKSLAMEDMYVERLAERLGLSAPTVSFHLKKLADAGLVRSYKAQYYTMFALCREALDLSVLSIVSQRSDEAAEQAQRERAYQQKVLDSFFEYGKLKTIPTQRKKERIVLEEIAKAFAYDCRYTEKEVNLTIADFYDDFCTIRRDMIAENLLARADGLYWRVRPDAEMDMRSDIMTHKMNLWHDSFVKIQQGTKTIEMRLWDEKRARIAVGDRIVFTDTETGAELLCVVIRLHRYPNFQALYAHHDKVSIGYAEQEPADPNDMLLYYSKEDIAKYGVVGIELQALQTLMCRNRCI